MCHLLISTQILTVLQYLSSTASMIGTILLALKLIPPRVAFWFWFLSYLVDVPYFGLSTQWGMLAVSVCGVTTSIIGVVQWRKSKKKVLGVAPQDDQFGQFSQEKTSAA